jgi:Fe-S oxidoreductase/FAD/FMN-containing dehydrogenase
MMAQSNLEKDLKKIVGDRVTISEFERWYYARDLVSIPAPIRNLFKTTPEVVVRPQTTDEVAAVARYCYRQGIPIVPRGAGSSGLFGAVPKKGGAVLELTDLARIIEIDAEQETATAQAGATWWQLEKALSHKGLTLRSYPSSARSATLGGWLMTSGLGIGTLKYGPVFEHIVSAEVVLANGTIKEYAAGSGLAPFFETEGILGIMTRLTLRVRHKPEMVSHHLFYFTDIKNLFQALAPLARAEPRPYNIEIQDHRYLALLKAGGYPVTDFTPSSGVLLVTYDGNRGEVAAERGQIAKLAGQYGGVEIGGGERAWGERFNMLRIKRAVPSLLPSSVYMPLDKAGRFYCRLGRLKKRTIALIGHVISLEECNLMPMVATDERKRWEYLFALHTPSQVANLALSLGGRPGGGLGVWNAPYKNELLDKEKFAEIKKLKAELDPKNIMNPGLWLESPVLFQPAPYSLAMGAASVLDKIVPTRMGRGDKEGFAREFSACVQCGYCMDVCPTRLGWLSSTPRGRILMTRQLFLENPGQSEKMAPWYLNRIFQCTLCGRCRVDCIVDIKSRPMWLGVRHFLVKNGLEMESLKSLTKITDEMHNIASRPNEQRINWASRVKLPYLTTKKTADYVYFVGCVSSFFPMAQPAARAFVQILDAAGVDLAIVGGEEWCCGFPLMSAGHHELAEKCLRHNIERLHEMGAKNLVMTCPGCYRVWKGEYYEVIGEKHPFNVLHSTELISRLIESGRIKIRGLEEKLTYHDPCDLGRNGGIFDEPRYIIGRIPGLNFVEMEDNREYCTCCGSGGDLLASNQELALAIARRKVDEILSTGTQTVATACPSCVRAIHMAKTAARVKLDVLDITELLWKAMGNQP